jgi:hypothetical protein
MRRRRCAVRSTFPILIAAAPLTLAACGVDVVRARQGSDDGYPPPSLAVAAFAPAASTRHEDAGELQALDGDDFTLRYPGDATVRPLEADGVPGASSALEIRGPELRDSEGEPIEGSASYSLEVVSYPNPDRLSLDAWLARHRERENGADALRAARLPASGEPTDGPVSAAVGGLPALRESRFGGDCQLVRYYVARGTRVVALRYADFPVESDSLNPENLRTYGRLMNSFRWKGK